MKKYVLTVIFVFLTQSKANLHDIIIRGTLIEGYNLVYSNAPVKARVSLWTHRTDETCLIQYQNNNGQVTTAFIDISQKENALDAMHKALDESRAYGNVVITEMS